MTEVYGVGAFLAAGCQIYKMAVDCLLYTSLAGLAEVLQELPKGLMERAYYEELFIRLCTRIAGLQNRCV